MATRSIIKIDEEKCNGCGLCIPNCPEGALQIIDGKARLISDLFCDGLGACIGHCPEGAIEIEKREAQPYDESSVMENIIKAGDSTIKAHLEHLKDHQEHDLYNIAVDVLKQKGLEVPIIEDGPVGSSYCGGGCPGSKMMDFSQDKKNVGDESISRVSELQQWPVQLHLVPPTAPYFNGADVVLAADCVAYSLADFHKNHLKGKSLAIACPKLDQGLDIYIEKITSMIDDAKINTLTVMTMEVPCCGGLVSVAEKAREKASRTIPVKHIMVSIKGDILDEQWLE